ncbi:MAG: pectate lyase [Burkholderiales bacterium]|nr:pectate lyase [Phycisphaerae bacterium]
MDAKNYGHAITFNDNATVNILKLEYDVLHDPDFAFIDEATRAKVKDSYDRGIDCTLKCQLTVDGKFTAWAQQYDAEKMVPVKARAFELEGLAAGESSAILGMFMDIQNPSEPIRQAVHAGAEWFESVKITGKKLEKRDGDIFVVDDPAAEPMWSRFYEIGTNRPFFVGRDGIKKYDVSEIEKERRLGYAWLRPFWGADVAKKYADWKLKYPK